MAKLLGMGLVESHRLQGRRIAVWLLRATHVKRFRANTWRNIVKCAIFLWLGVLAPWQWGDMVIASHIAKKEPMLVPSLTWGSFTMAWLAIHAYCVGFVIWGRWRSVLVSEPGGTPVRGRLILMVLGAILMMTAYVLLVRAIINSW